MLNFLKKSTQTFLALILLGASCQTAQAKPSETWHLSIAPYAWASALGGNVGVKGHSADVDITFFDILKHLNFAAQGHFEAGYGPWTLMLDPTYLRLTDTRNLRYLGLNLTAQTLLIDAGVFYRFYSKPITENRYISLELLGGSRYLGLKNSLTVSNALTFSDSTNMMGPIFGGRFRADLTPKLGFWLRADVGGFDVDYFKNTWSTTLGISYAIKHHIDLGLAYRILKIQYAKASSNMNLLMYGPMLGISFHW